MMNRTKIVLNLLLGLLVFLFLPGLSGQVAAGELLDKVGGNVSVHDETIKGDLPNTVPQTFYIQDFELDGTNLNTDQGVLDRASAHRRLPLLRQTNDPREEARNLVNLMSESLQEDFRKSGFTAQRLDSTGRLPGKGWLVRGVFTEVDEGGRVRRAIIGFGSGATSMEVNVSVSDLAGNSEAPFIIFGTFKDPKKMPGAVVTRNPYVAAAKFVLEKNASEKDIKKTAKAIVDEILKVNDKLKEEAAASRPTRDSNPQEEGK